MRHLEWDEFSIWAWARREMPVTVDAVYIDSEHFIAGDRDGNLSCWNVEGGLVWNGELGARIECLTVADVEDKQVLLVTAGLEILSISMSNGEINWRVELEGSSESVLYDSKNSRIIATSSVYDIEYHAFMEGACWFFSQEGNSLAVERFDERVWHLALDEERIIMGLGRPRGGMLIGNLEGFEHVTLSDSPISCGDSNQNMNLLGHADGSFTLHNESNTETNLSGGSTLTAALMVGDIAVVADQYGMLAAFREGEMLWSMDLDNEIDGLAAVSFEENEAIWVCTFREGESGVFLLGIKEGEVLLSCKVDKRVRCISAHNSHVVFGLGDGEVLLHEMGMIARRLNADGGDDNHDHEEERKREMRERLRRLR